jgi:multimeric flavodoxin WrbA
MPALDERRVLWVPPDACAPSFLIARSSHRPLPRTPRLADVVVAALEEKGVDVDVVRAVNRNVPPGIDTDLGEGDDWSELHRMVLDSQILVMATPTWLGKPSSIAQRVLERMDAMISETRDDGTYVAYGKVAGVVVTGNEDGAHHVIGEIAGGLIDVGFTIPVRPGRTGTWGLALARRTWKQIVVTTGRRRPAERWLPTCTPTAATALQANPLPPPS